MIYYRERTISSFLVILILNFSIMTNVNAEPTELQKPRSIHVSGLGKAYVTPDKADLSLSVEVQAKTAQAARQQAAVSMEALIKAVKNSGVADKDIQTRSVSLYPNYSPDTANKIAGYQLTNQVSVCIRDVDKASDIIDSAVKAGGNATRLQGINFGIENADSALAQAREKAYGNAKMKAEQYAELAGVTLGSPLHISEGNEFSPAPIPYAEMRSLKAGMADSASTPVQAGEQEVTVNVDVIFGIQ